MKIPRTKELIQVGYYLSRFGLEDPPVKLKTDKWKEAYRLFYDSLNNGRGVLEFENSLKNSRDEFDGYFSNNREGWKDGDKPTKLSSVAQEVYNDFSNKDENFIWSIINAYSNEELSIGDQIFNDLIAEDKSNSDSNTVTEGGVKMRISKVIERNSKLRQIALEIHGYKCQVCDFDFEKKYGNWGKNFAEYIILSHSQNLKGKKLILIQKLT